ncbi:CYTH and CHAD domain-containing protein [Indioceanicola profundi]|uniref:CYTH and CHAD domain-containing protein n=1 Tax=Indioceanicola profundi TaxID=2220096 RepID=UPI0013C4F150|nr:CYTH and CHAD domain-containing protein [Indioceanicola profundi]
MPRTAGTSSGGREVELKLHATPGDLTQIAELDLVSAATIAGPGRKRQHTTYYDTPGLELARRGLALRVRREAGRQVQAVKTMGGGGAGDSAAIAIRREWEWEITGDGPDLATLRTGELATVVPADLLDQLGPVFSTDVQRATFQLRPHPQAEVELALDRGQISARSLDGGTTHAAISEVELELKNGRLADLFSLALAIHERVPLRLASRSKADLGLTLLTGRLPAAAPARPLGLTPFTTVAEAFRHIGRNGLSHLLDNEPAVLAGSDPEALREMAAAVRRLDAAFGLFKTVVTSARGKGLRTELRHLGAALETARTWERMHDRHIAPLMHDADSPRSLAAAVAGRRRVARVAALESLASPRWTGWMLAFGAWLEGGDWAEGGPFAVPMTELAPTLLAERLDRVARAAKVLSGKEGGENWRKLWRRTQRLRYAVDFCRAVFPPDRVRPLRTAVEDFRAVLKVAADADQAIGLLDDLAEETGPAARAELKPLRRKLDRVRAEARRDLVRSWTALRTAPQPFG